MLNLVLRNAVVWFSGSYLLHEGERKDERGNERGNMRGRWSNIGDAVRVSAL